MKTPLHENMEDLLKSVSLFASEYCLSILT